MASQSETGGWYVSGSHERIPQCNVSHLLMDVCMSTTRTGEREILLSKDLLQPPLLLWALPQQGAHCRAASIHWPWKLCPCSKRGEEEGIIPQNLNAKYVISATRSLNQSSNKRKNCCVRFLHC